MGEKKSLKQNEVKLLRVPQYPELSVKVLYPRVRFTQFQISQDPLVSEYLQDYGEGELPSKEYFFKVPSVNPQIAGTIHHQALKELVDEALKLRNQCLDPSDDKEAVLLSQEMWDQFQMSSFTSSKFASRFREKRERGLLPQAQSKGAGRTQIQETEAGD